MAKTFSALPLFVGVKLHVLLRVESFAHPFIMAKTLSYYVKTTPKLFLPPPPLYSMAKTFSAKPPPLFLSG